MSAAKGKVHWSLYLYCLFLAVPLYWLISMAVKPNRDILGGLELLPSNPTLANFVEILTNPAWYGAFINSPDLCVPERRPVHHRCAARRLCVLALPLPGRQGSSFSGC